VSLGVRVVLFAAVLAVAAIGLVSYLEYGHDIDALLAQLAQYLEDTAGASAACIPGELHEQVRLPPQSDAGPYHEVQAYLQRAFDESSLGQESIYTLVAFDGQGTVVCSVGAGPRPGQTVQLTPVLQRAFAGGERGWMYREDTPIGPVVTGYAPIRRWDNGKAVALLLVEAPPRIVTQHRSETLHRTVLFASAGVVFASLLSLLFVRALLRPVRELVGLAELLRQGDYDTPVECCGVGEIGLLAQTMEQMRQALRQRIKELSELNLDLAHRVQSSIIPRPQKSEFMEVAVTYRPFVSVGGDYAHLRFSAPDVLYVSIGDVTGHGVPAALLVNRVHGLIDQLCREGLPPDEMLRRINSAVLSQFQQSATFMTFLAVDINLRTGQFLYSNAGHPPGLILRNRDGKMTVEELRSQCTFLGIDEELICDVQALGVAELAPGDRLLLYTDGVVEASPGRPREFGQEGILRVISENDGLPPQELIERVMEEAVAFAGGELEDDALILLVDVTGTSKKPGGGEATAGQA